MKRLVIALAACTALSVPSFAEVVPAPSAHDPRIRVVNYDPMNMVRVVCANHRSTSIQFDPTETVDAIANGDEKAWTVAPHGSVVFITPVESDGGLRPTNMQIVTRRADGSSRIYQLDLVAQDDPNGLMAGVVFRYPSDAAAKRAAERAKAREEQDSRIARQRLDVDFMYGPRNWAYMGRGSHAIEPSEVSDNGQITAFRFPGIAQVPSIFTGQCGADTERSVTANARDDLVIVPTIAPYFCLRLGNGPAAQTFEIKSVHYNQTGINYMTGTTTPEVVRRVKGRRH